MVSLKKFEVLDFIQHETTNQNNKKFSEEILEWEGNHFHQ